MFTGVVLLAGACEGALISRARDAGAPDASLTSDATTPTSDAGGDGWLDGGPRDAALLDGDVGHDAGAPDAGRDAGGAPDAGRDAGAPDAGRDAGGAPDAGRDAGSPDSGPAPGPCPGDRTDVLVRRDGVFFTPSLADPVMTFDLGGAGVCYERVEICFDVRAGGFQPQRPGEVYEREEHILFNMFRRAPDSWGRYLMGTAAVSFPSAPPHFRMFGRRAIMPGGASTYTSVSGRFAWADGTTYHLCCSLDGASHRQRCELSRGGTVVATRDLDVAYLDPTVHLSTGLSVDIGAVPTGTIETSPIGWVFSSLIVRASR